MDKLGYTVRVRKFLEGGLIIRPAYILDRQQVCDPDKIDWALEVVGQQGSPVWSFLKTKALQVAEHEEKVCGPGVHSDASHLQDMLPCL